LLISGFIASGEDHLAGAKTRAGDIWGPISRESPVIPFDFTKYYEPEMGPRLLRQFVAFRRLIEQEALPDFKVQARTLEAELGDSSSGRLRRRANIDPGYLTLERLVLATTKNYSHRIYLRDGIFAELALAFCSDTFRPLEWTYPDYRTALAIEFFNTVRDDLKDRLRG